MQLVSIRENEIRVDLDWGDVRLLAFTIRHARQYDVGSGADDPSGMLSYLDTALAFLEAAGLASWAHTVEREEYTLEHFAENVPITPEEHRRWRERCEAAQREHAEEQALKSETPPAAEGKDGEAA